MIVAKTKMKKIPESCNKCDLSIYNIQEWSASKRYCAITEKTCPMKKTSEGEWKHVRPKWCPLMEE